MKTYRINFYELDKISLDYEPFTVMELSRNNFSSKDLSIVFDELRFLAATAEKSIGEVVAVMKSEENIFALARIYLDEESAYLEIGKPYNVYSIVRTMDRVNL